MYLWGRELEGGFKCRRKMGQKRDFSLKRTITCENSQSLLKSCFSFGGGFEGSNEGQMGSQQKEDVL